MNRISDIDEGTIRRVDWQALVPPTILLRAFSATFKPSFLVVGAVLAAFFASFLGFYPLPAPCTTLFTAMDGVTPESVDCAPVFPCVNELAHNCTLGQICFGRSPIFPGIVLFSAIIALWFALAVARTAVVGLTTTSRSSTIASMLFATVKLRSIVPSALLPLFFALATALAAFFAGRAGAFGVACAPILMVVELGLVVAGAVVALAFPLSLTAVAAENSDCFDAISRGVSYVTQRFLFLIFYAFFSAILTIIGACVVEVVAELAQHLLSDAYLQRDSFWVDFWRFVVMLLPYVYCAISAIVYSAAIYVALRRSVDGTPYDSCVLDLSGRKPRELRKILKDGKGAPTFDAENAEERAAEKTAEAAEDTAA